MNAARIAYLLVFRIDDEDVPRYVYELTDLNDAIVALSRDIEYRYHVDTDTRLSEILYFPESSPVPVPCEWRVIESNRTSDDYRLVTYELSCDAMPCTAQFTVSIDLRA